MATTEGVRRFYARLTAANASVDDPRLVEAFASVERERFLWPGPWHVKVATGYIATETDDPAVLYQDVVVGLIPEKGINNGEPTLHARSIAAAAPKVGDVVVHVGAGTRGDRPWIARNCYSARSHTCFHRDCSPVSNPANRRA